MREKTVSADMYHQQIGYCNKNETCVLYPKMPKAWLANGLIIVPSLSEKGEEQIAQNSFPLLSFAPSSLFSLFQCLFDVRAIAQSEVLVPLLYDLIWSANFYHCPFCQVF